MNWFFFRCLAQWAEAHMDSHTIKPDARKVFALILDHLRPLRPEDAEALTIADTMGDLHRNHPDLNMVRVGEGVAAMTASASKKVTIH